MKALIYLLLYFPWLLSAQHNYTEALQQGQAAAQKGDYEMALKKYRAAQAFDPGKRGEVDQEIDAAFSGMRQQRDKAVKAEKVAKDLVKQVEAEKEKALVEKEKAQAAEQVAKDLVRQVEAEKKKAQAAERMISAVLDKIYFYADRFGLAYDKNTGRYGFIDKTLHEKVAFKYHDAQPFDYTGYARVKKDDDYYLIDTLGKEYPLATKIGQLDRSVTALDLRYQKFTKIPAAIFANPQLKVLLLGGNILFSLPAEIETLTNLQSLDLQGNKLDSLPIELGRLARLKSLNLGGNKLHNLPAEIGQLANLQSLILSGNILSNLPLEIEKLTNLHTLDLNSNKITTIPMELGKLVNLQALNLRNNQIASLPPEIGKLINLQWIDLQINYLTSLPSEMGKLTQLRSLYLSSNQLSSLPVEIRKMRHLTYIDLQENPFSTTEIVQLRKDMLWCSVRFPPTPKEVSEQNKSTCLQYAREAAAAEIVLQNNPSDSLKIVVANTYNFLAWYQILTQQFAEAEQSVHRAVELDSTNLYSHTNLPPALLLQGKNTDAQTLYREWKDKPFGLQNAANFKVVFLDDFKTFEQANIIPPQCAADVAAIKKLLNE